ncbi:MAG: CoA-transferase [bacterium]|nr:CoA-transferase [bacterium]
MSDFTRAEVCVAACADCYRGDGEKLASAFGTIPMIGAKLARSTFEPDLVMTDGIASTLANVLPVSSGPDGKAPPEPVVDGWFPFRTIFDVLWSGQRHVIMIASQIDRFGNQNFACIGDYRKPKAQLLGMRGAPGNTISHTTSYWIPNHSRNTFVEKVDVVSGVGYDRARALGEASTRHHEVRRVVSNLAVFDFGGADQSMRLVSLHPGVSIDEVVEATGFELEVADSVPETRGPNEQELVLIRDVLDPGKARDNEVKA